jgi:hypothetical protein
LDVSYLLVLQWWLQVARSIDHISESLAIGCQLLVGAAVVAASCEIDRSNIESMTVECQLLVGAAVVAASHEFD